jgi:hypothetical protein
MSMPGGSRNSIGCEHRVERQSARQSVRGRVLVAFADDVQRAVLLLHTDALRNRDAQLAFGSFHTQFLTDGDLDAGGNGNGLLADS